jgi:3-dehydroquinate synthase
MKKHTIRFKDKPKDSYPIFIGRGLLPDVSQLVKEHISQRRQAILTDQNVVDAGHLAKVDPKGEIPTYIIQPDENKGVESKKNLLTIGKVVDFLDAHKFEKRDVLICLGGGVIGDSGGVAAYGYKRGKMVYIQVPTTSLSQADSCVGGKVAVDGDVSKNSFGGIYQPHFVLIDPTALQTQDDRNYRSGLVESIKHGSILKAAYFDFLEGNLDKILARDLGVLEAIALENVQLKGGVVEVDPNDKNYRHSLNFGHTVGHAVEQASKYQLYHGESVAIGTLPALYISRELRGLPQADFDRIRTLLVDGLGMRDKVPDFVDRAVVEGLLANDKKAIDGVPQFVTIEGIGKLHAAQVKGFEEERYSAPVPKSLVKEALDYIF